jgi:hypothetical protein
VLVFQKKVRHKIAFRVYCSGATWTSNSGIQFHFFGEFVKLIMQILSLLPLQYCPESTKRVLEGAGAHKPQARYIGFPFR